MKPKQIIEIVAVLLVIACLWGVAHCILNPIEPWPTIEGLEKSHDEHASHLTTYASTSLRFG